MNEKNHLDPELVVSYLYDECGPEERASVAAHLKSCVPCADEIASLSATREHLAGWAPPDVALGFQITRSEAGRAVTPPGRVLRPARWWSQPLPAWAQAAAAVAIFGAGLAIGTGRSAAPDARPAAPAETRSAADAPAPPSAAVAEPTPAPVDLAAAVAQLRVELAEVKRAASGAAPAPAAAAATSAVLLDQVRTLIDESEQRQRIDFTARWARLGRELELTRRVDHATFDERIGRVQGEVGAEIVRQQQSLDGVARAVGLVQTAR